MSIKNAVRRLTRSRLGLDFGNWAHTPGARRVQMWEHYGINSLVDIGANVGQYAAEARQAGYRGHILSVEPVTTAFRPLAEAASKDGAWDVRQVAVGSSRGTLTMHVSEGSIFSSPLQILDGAVAASPNARQVSTEDVTAIPLDELAPQTDERTAVKIDVQGFERDVLLGGARAISRARIVELELSPLPIYDGQMLIVEALERMQQAGLVLSLTENLFPEGGTGRALQFNGIFVRP